ncbi:MAG: AAA family ATPase [Candidatus Contendobacter odensis]|uniref:AAA family ATPase n=1 Tax=Candidatus Contendibacter odensensis TaxID=1400860 RepID=A0A2G6PFT2_9GAMM|nr:MAG: AAA family ATPase [Candidatus Contendobacter odensis]
MARIDLSLEQSLAERLYVVLERLEASLPPKPLPLDSTQYYAFRWQHIGQQRYLQPVKHPHRLRLSDLRQIDHQKAILVRNTRQFLAGQPCNNVLLWGARGTGKSSLIKALLNEYAESGLRLIEVDRQDLVELPAIVEPLFERSERFLLYCDDLSFEANDPGYKALKAMLDGSISAAPDNVLLCATSNRRHLLPEYQRDNQESQLIGGELHHGEAVEEKISLSERFGLWLAFHPFSQDDYLAIVSYWLAQLQWSAGLDETTRHHALQWALQRGSRSGRIAWQFARDWVGQHSL